MTNQLTALADALRNPKDPAQFLKDAESAATHFDTLATANEKMQPVAWLWQHDETGRVDFVDQWQLDNGWQASNPRLHLIAALVKQSDAQAAVLAAYEAGKAANQAVIDRLMLEYCPDEMTTEQKANWAAHQRPGKGFDHVFGQEPHHD